MRAPTAGTRTASLGLCDRHQLVCFAIALWNGKDPILKERPFGLSNSQGNHGEDVKDYWFYLDATPTASYLRALYKYPQAEFPYAAVARGERAAHDRSAGVRARRHRRLRREPLLRRRRRVRQGRPRGRADRDHRRQPRARRRRTLDLLPTVWFRNTWWKPGRDPPGPPSPATRADGRRRRSSSSEPYVGRRLPPRGAGRASCSSPRTRRTSSGSSALRTRRPTSRTRSTNTSSRGERTAVNPAPHGHEGGGPLPALTLAAGASAPRPPAADRRPGPRGHPLSEDFDRILAQRRAEADEFYAAVLPERLSADERNVARQAFAGMLWSKQFYQYDVRRLAGRRSRPAAAAARSASQGRNHDWHAPLRGAT